MIDFGYLEGFANFEKQPGEKRDFHLDNMRTLLDDFSRPDRDMELIHIAGSKGKGSTAAVLASLLADETGAPVGIYSSPHVSDYRERIRSALPRMDDFRNGFFSDEVYSASLDDIKRYMSEPGHNATTFELLTLLAFLVFQRAGLRRAVIEVGLGGRLDSTNVIQPLLSIITPIELEHTKYLGDTIGKIAVEKAGIIKSRTPVLLGDIKPEALESILPIADERDARVFKSVDYEPEFSGIIAEAGMADRDINTLPRFYRLNALCAYSALRIFQNLTAKSGADQISVPTVGSRNDADQNTPAAGFARRLAALLQSPPLPGRFERRQLSLPGGQERPVILDAAHTPESLRQLVSAIEQRRGFAPHELTVIFSCLEDKDADSMLTLLIPRCSRLIITGTGNFKRADIPGLYAKALRAAEGHAIRPELVENTGELCAIIRSGQAGSGVLITGSFYLLGELASCLDMSER